MGFQAFELTSWWGKLRLFWEDGDSRVREETRPRCGSTGVESSYSETEAERLQIPIELHSTCPSLLPLPPKKRKAGAIIQWSTCLHFMGLWFRPQHRRNRKQKVFGEFFPWGDISNVHSLFRPSQGQTELRFPHRSTWEADWFTGIAYRMWVTPKQLPWNDACEPRFPHGSINRFN